MKKTVFKLLAGAILILFSIELFLQIFGDRLPSKLNSTYLEVNESENEYQVLVLCLGDSITAWGMQDSYPSQLQKILNQTVPKKFLVVNASRLGETSESIIETFKKNLENIKPTIVVSMVGLNDYKITERDEILSHIRTYVLAKHLSKVFRNSLVGETERIAQIFERKSTPKIFVPTAKSDWMAVQTEIKRHLEINKTQEAYEGVLNYLLSDGAELTKEAYVLAIQLANETLASWPNSSTAVDLRAVAAASVTNHEQLESYLKEAYHRNTKNPLVHIYYIKFLKRENRRAEALKVVKEALSGKLFLKSRNKQILEEELLSLMETNGDDKRDQNDLGVTVKNQLAFNKLLLEHEIFHVILPYPKRNILETKNELSGFSNVAFADYGSFFDETNKEYDSFFVDKSAGDFGHLAPKSAEFIAQKAAEIILSETQNRQK